MNKRFLIFLNLFVSLFPCILHAEGKLFTLTYDQLDRDTSVYFASGWKYNPGNNIKWASPDFNDSTWAEINTYSEDAFPSNWKGEGWFRFHFSIDSQLYDKPVSLQLWSAGTQKVYLDGKYLASNSNWKNPKTFSFSQQPNHIIAVKFTNNDIDYYLTAGFQPGFLIGFGDADKSIQSGIQEIKRTADEQMFFSAITLGFALLHLILFLFNRQFRENLIYSIFLFVFAAAIFIDYQSNLAVNITEMIFYLRLHRLIMALSQILALLSLYAIFKQRTTKFFNIIAVYYIGAVILALIKPEQYLFFIEIGMILMLIECIRIIRKSSRERTEGVWIIAAGFSILFIFSFYDWLLDFNLINTIGNVNNGYPFGTIGLFICMSIFLSKNFAKSNLRIVQQEQLNKEQEIERKYLEAENKRKSLELEDARKLQLSILPKFFPEMPNVEISAKMRTAAEVGGDYYDYHLSSDGIITLAIGDATGHGIKAGIMVTLMKSLFDAMAHTFFIPDFFNQCTRTIRKMNLGNLYMGMTILKIREYKITASAAGMPPFLVFRKNTCSVEEIILKGMPLGAFTDFQYQQKMFSVSPGDIILLLTDGFTELFNAKREMLDFDAAKKLFFNAARNDSPDIIGDLLNEADKWLNGFHQDDDITFLLIRVK